jgi:hypothetical protein
MANATTHIVAVSDFETDYIHRTFGVSYDKVSVIPRGVDGV